MQLISSAHTIAGRRKNNEDAYLEAAALNLFAVADGVGGYEGGEIASQLVTQTLADFIADAARDPDGTWPIRPSPERTWDENLLAAAGAAAHREILKQKTGLLSQMASTVVSALFHDAGVTVMHCGDSRLYRLRNGQVQGLTRDHSLWAEMEAAGLTTNRRQYLYKNQITRALGLDGHARCDVMTFPVERGDVYLLCSDGLYDPFDDVQLAELMCEPTEVIVQKAYDAGSSDNITGVRISVQ